MIEIKAYSGLIRNHRELATELGVSIEGMTRRAREEALIAAAYERWGSDLGAHLNGQFGIALYDTRTGDTFCTRDILGAELFFTYVTEEGALLYGTTITSLFDQPGFKRELNRELIQFYLGFTYVPGEETLFAGVTKLEPGGWLRCDAAGVIERGRYWELTYEPDESKTLDEWADAIEQAMEESMRCIIDEDEQCDSFLSGGVDSSYMLAKGPARTGYCAAYANQAASEEAEARETAGYLERGFEGIIVEPEEFFGTLDEFLRAYEQPSADAAGLAFYVACKKVAQKSRLCFSGEGSDEFFGGYNAYRRAEEFRSNPDPVYFGTTYIMHSDVQRRFLKSYCENRSTRDFMRERGEGGMKYDPVTWMLYTDARSYLEGSILFNSTKIAQGTGLDIRMPYLDLRMFDIARRMPSRFKVGEEGNKLALRRAASRVLPEHIAYRKKLGFPVPVRAWLADEQWNADIRRAFASDVAHEFFNEDEISALLDEFLGGSLALWHRVWTIYVFIRWYELFFAGAVAGEAPAGEAPADVAAASAVATGATAANDAVAGEAGK